MLQLKNIQKWEDGLNETWVGDCKEDNSYFQEVK